MALFSLNVQSLFNNFIMFVCMCMYVYEHVQLTVVHVLYI